jgi:hypothetical protein
VRDDPETFRRLSACLRTPEDLGSCPPRLTLDSFPQAAFPHFLDRRDKTRYPFLERKAALMNTSRHHPYALCSLLAATILALIPASAHAASITWGIPTNITGDTDVSTTGSLIGAFNIGDTGVSSTTLNSVNFQGFAVPDNSSGATSGNFAMSTSTAFQSSNNAGGGANPPFSALSAQYQTLLGAVTLNSGGQPFTLTISGLTVGAQYAFQWWTDFSGGDANEFTTATAGDSVTLQSNTSSAVGGVGQFAIGTFTADAATQSITFGSNVSHAILNGFQLREIAVPEGSTLLLVALGSCVCLFTARRRRCPRAF